MTGLTAEADTSPYQRSGRPSRGCMALPTDRLRNRHRQGHGGADRESLKSPRPGRRR